MKVAHWSLWFIGPTSPIPKIFFFSVWSLLLSPEGVDLSLSFLVKTLRFPFSIFISQLYDSNR